MMMKSMAAPATLSMSAPRGGGGGGGGFFAKMKKSAPRKMEASADYCMAPPPPPSAAPGGPPPPAPPGAAAAFSFMDSSGPVPMAMEEREMEEAADDSCDEDDAGEGMAMDEPAPAASSAGRAAEPSPQETLQRLVALQVCAYFFCLQLYTHG